MEQKKHGLPASPLTKAPSLRRKLQKSFSRQQSNAARRSLSISSPSRTPDITTNTTNKATPPLPPLPPLPPVPKHTSPNVSVRREGRFYTRDPPFAPLERLGDRAYIVPEFSHLIKRDPPPQPLPGSASAPATPRMKRRAKTPIFSIGQLEDIPRPSNALSRTSSVDLIAEQYRAILESRRSSIYSDNHSEPSLSPRTPVDDEPSPVQQRRSLNYFADESPIRAPTRGPLNPSPTSDDGTLVSFQDDTVYFKPFSFSPEPESPPPHTRRDSSPDDNVGLQICLDLLTRDLSSAIAGRPCRSSVGTSALQVLVMIEAYERLRDQMAELSHSNEEARSMEMMFDMWLRALYTIHDSMTRDQRVVRDGYGAELGTEELD